MKLLRHRIVLFSLSGDLKILLNSQCYVKHLLYHIKRKAGLKDTDRLELCTADGTLTNTIGRQNRYFNDISPNSCRQTLVAVKIDETADHVTYTPLLDNAFQIYPDIRESLVAAAAGFVRSVSPELYQLPPSRKMLHRHGPLACDHDGDPGECRLNFKTAASALSKSKNCGNKSRSSSSSSFTSHVNLQVKPADRTRRGSQAPPSFGPAEEQLRSLVTLTRTSVQAKKSPPIISGASPPKYRRKSDVLK